MSKHPSAGKPVDNTPSHKAKLLQLIETKIAEAGTTKPKRARAKPSARTKANQENSIHSTGPKTDEGKAKVSANALKAGFFANVERLHPQDSPAYQDAVEDLRLGLHPDGPVEEMLIRELATFRARLLRLESAEYAILCSGIETGPAPNDGFVVRDQELDSRELAASMINSNEALERLQKAEVHLRRAYNRTWDRLERMQKERLKMPFDAALKQTQIWATHEAIRTTCPKCAAAQATPDSPAHEQWKKHVPPLHPDLDENGNRKTYPHGHPLYRPNEKQKSEE